MVSQTAVLPCFGGYVVRRSASASSRLPKGWKPMLVA
jgi:hypothetical protein